MSCASLSCSAVRQCDRSCTIEFGKRGVVGKDGTCAAACGGALRDCEGCLRDCDLANCGPVRPLHYSLPGAEDWDPLAAMPGLEQADKSAKERKKPQEEEPPAQAEPVSEFEEIVRMLDLKRCPNCRKDWTKKAKEDGVYPKRDPWLDKYSVQPFAIQYKGKTHCVPYAELTARAIKLCPYCVYGTLGRPAPKGLMDSSDQGGGRV
mmetsp:Transcript_41296/g.119478  ORF Transcript_41296/g.119478 Transcript_41296/m.119478 type:complete len:206 (-) Transcript_41296:94-711(-)